MLIMLANLSPACVLNHAAASIIHHCIIISQSRGSSHGGFVWHRLGEQAGEGEQTEIHMSTVSIISRDYLCDLGLTRLEQRQGYQVIGRFRSDLMTA